MSGVYEFERQMAADGCWSLVTIPSPKYAALLAERDALAERVERLRQAIRTGIGQNDDIGDRVASDDLDGSYAAIETQRTALCDALRADDEAAGR